MKDAIFYSNYCIYCKQLIDILDKIHYLTLRVSNKSNSVAILKSSFLKPSI